MAISEHEVLDAEKRMAARRARRLAVSALYDRSTDRIEVILNTGVEIAFPPRLVQGLAEASADELADIEISPAGLGLHWPKLDADLYVPALLEGAFGSKRWMAAQLGAAGGRAQSDAKAAAARENGRKGGRPRKPAQDDPALAKLAERVRVRSIDDFRAKPAKQGSAKAERTADERKALAKERKLTTMRAERHGPKRAPAKRKHA